MNKEELWRALTEPTYHSCFNCEYKRVISYIGNWVPCGGDRGHECALNGMHYTKWEWNGKK